MARYRAADQMVVDYQAILAASPDRTREGLVIFLKEELPWAWINAYRLAVPRQIDVREFELDGFLFLHDTYDLEKKLGRFPNRLVGVYGISRPVCKPRPSTRQRGWLGPTNTHFGEDKDKGHYIAQSISGSTLCVEANLFVQDRALNRGRSTQGKLYRRMETYCARNAGTFCFSRPHYDGDEPNPSRIDFGLVTTNAQLWVETFENRQNQKNVSPTTQSDQTTSSG